MAREGKVVTSRKERLLARLTELGAQPKRSLGQNFLISDHVVEKIIEAAKSEPFAQLIEVGPGVGAITEDLADLSDTITLIELDRQFADAWRARGFRVVEADALALNWNDLGLPAGTLFVSNLPYQISSSLVVERSMNPAGVTRMVLMFQKEVAQRLAAQPRSKDYGLLTVIAQTFWDLRKVVDAGPGCFFPPPNVSSRVMSFKSKASDVDDRRADYLRFVKAAFAQRRKLMSRNLLSYFVNRDGLLAEIEALFEDQGLAVTARAEELDPPAFVRLYQASETLR